eukprot:s2667_g8.t1
MASLVFVENRPALLQSDTPLVAEQPSGSAGSSGYKPVGEVRGSDECVVKENADFVLAFAWHKGNLTPIKVRNGCIVDGNDLSEWELSKDDLEKMTCAGLIALASRADGLVYSEAEEEKRQKMNHAELVELVHSNFDRIVSETTKSKEMFSFARAIGSCFINSDEVIEEGKGKISKFIEMVEGGLDRDELDAEGIDYQLAHLDAVLEQCGEMKEKLLGARDEARSTPPSSPASSDASAQLEKYEKMASATPTEEAFSAFNQKTFDLGAVSYKSLLLRLPTMNGVAIATINYDQKTYGSEVV